MQSSEHHLWKHSIMNWNIWGSPNSFLEILTPNVMISKCGVFGRCRALISETKRDSKELCHLPYPAKTQWCQTTFEKQISSIVAVQLLNWVQLLATWWTAVGSLPLGQAIWQTSKGKNNLLEKDRTSSIYIYKVVANGKINS